MRLLRPLARLIWGSEVDPALRPVLAIALAGSLAPFFGLQVGDRYGDTAMWGLFAALAVVGAVLGALACLGTRRAVCPSAVLES